MNAAKELDALISRLPLDQQPFFLTRLAMAKHDEDLARLLLEVKFELGIKVPPS